MYLDAAEERQDLFAENKVEGVGGRWNDFPASTLLHHSRPCCDMAIEWLRGMDFAQLNGASLLSGPRWLRERYQWGPSEWPMHWCDAVDHERLDCGAHAALAQLLFDARGIANYRAQFIQRYNPAAVEQWRTIWRAEEASTHWLDDQFIYHEGNAILVGDGIAKLWDGSAGCWVKEVQSGGYGSVVAVRMFANQGRAEPATVLWGGHRLAFNVWQQLPAAPPTGARAMRHAIDYC